MTICNQLHEEIVFDGGDCPLCTALNERAEFKELNEELCNRIAELLDERDAYRAELRL